MSSAQRKLDRGIQQAHALYREAKTFEDGQAYLLETKRDDRSADEIVYVCHAIEREAPSSDWPLVLGEVVHNLRGALDHVIYAQTKSRKSGFPVFHDACEFQVYGRSKLSGVKESVRAIVEGAQPFNTLPSAPKQAPLYVLHSFWNADKHRELKTVAAAVRVPGAAYSAPREGAELHITHWASGVRLENGAHVMTLAVTGPKADQMEVNPYLIYEVTVEGRSLRNFLSAITKISYGLVHECETGESLPLMTVDQRLAARYHGWPHLEE